MKIEEVFARRRFIMLDGAMGTQLQLRGLTTEQKPELAAFIMPDVLTAVHRDYARAGADILLANTFGANPRKLKGTGYTVQQVIEASIACARTAAQETGALVALDIGPIGELLAPAGTLPFEDACAQFAEMVRAGAAAGADLVFLETMTDLYELKAAILAAKENCDLPVFTSMHLSHGSADATVILMRGDDIYLGDEDGIELSVSDQASLLMTTDASANHDSVTPTPTAVVSMWQTNSVAFRAHRYINWARRQAGAVAWAEVDWNGCS